MQKNHVCSKSKHGLVASNFKYHLPVELLLRNSFFNSSTNTSISSLVCIPIFFNESLITSDRLLDNLEYWRKPIIAVLDDEKEKVSLIDTEEHTAQVSNKDIRRKYWSTSENYELRFQDILKEGKEC